MIRNRLWLPILLVGVLAIAALIATTAGGTKRSSRSAVPSSSAISVKQTSAGRALVDASGRTLYLFVGDRPNLSRLSAAGRAVWPPFTAATRPTASGGALSTEIGTIAAPSGSSQITYNGHPLYYYVGDRSSGQTAGQGLNEFGAGWYVVSSAGAAITSTPKPAPQGGSASSSASPAGSGGGGYGY
jgi:predicted lipoprotein with Yx(FWY)xxD motif